MNIYRQAWLFLFVFNNREIATTNAFFIPTLSKTYGTTLKNELNTQEGRNDRRSLLLKGYGVLPLLIPYHPASASESAARLSNNENFTTSNKYPPPKLLADLPMIRLKLPRSSFGREYVAIKLMIQDKGPFDFMVDSGLTTELITPHLQKILGLSTSSKTMKSFAAGGETTGSPLLSLSGTSLCCGEFPSNNAQQRQQQQQQQLSLPPLTAIITDFPQEHIDPAHDPVEGMIGMELLSLFDVDFDFPAGRLRFWKAGTAAAAAARDGLVSISAAVINETGLIGIRMTTMENPSGQPVLAFLDCGSTFSVVNWSAAELLGFPPRGDDKYQKGLGVVAVGVDGRPIELPTWGGSRLTFCGDAVKKGAKVEFEKPPDSWRAWDAVPIAVGDIPAFSNILGDGKTPFRGPAALIGLDVLSQRRVILETSAGRKRRVFVDAASSK